MGTSEFAVPTMWEIVKGGHALVATYTRAPAAGGRRGLELKKTPVHVAADSIGIPVFTPTTLRTTEAEDVYNRHAMSLSPSL
jgi:methionyl-tRNA formyltransferase